MDRVKKQNPPEYGYDGHFPVVKIYGKYYAVKIKNKDMNIFIDRLKPAYLLWLM